MDRLPPTHSTWPTLTHERVMLMAANSEDQIRLRALFQRIRELEAEITWRDTVNLEEVSALKPECSPLTKAKIEDAAEKLFTDHRGRVFEIVCGRSLADVVHILCTELGVSE
jgi:hypothetical protein